MRTGYFPNRVNSLRLPSQGFPFSARILSITVLSTSNLTPSILAMKDLGWLPPKTNCSRYRLVRRRTLLTLALLATLATSAVVVQQWVWSGQNPHKTLDFDKALKVLNNPKENEDKRNVAYIWLYAQMLRSIRTMKAYEKTAPTKHKGDATNALNRLEKAARMK